MMQKKNFRKVFLIGVFLIVFLLLLGRPVKAKITWLDDDQDWWSSIVDLFTTSWEGRTEGVLTDVGDTFRNVFNNRVPEGTMNSGRHGDYEGFETKEAIQYGGAMWNYKIIKEDENKAGIAELTFDRLVDNGKTSIKVPNRIQCKILAGWTNVYYVKLTDTTFSSQNADYITALELPASILVDNENTLTTCLNSCAALSNFIKVYIPEIDSVDGTTITKTIPPVDSNGNPTGPSWTEPAIEEVWSNKINIVAENGVLFEVNKLTSKKTLVCYPRGKSDVENYYVPTDVVTIDKYSFCENATLKTVTLSDSVTKIKAHAFENNNINKIYFGNNPNLNTIEEYAFKGTNITEISIPATVNTFGTKIFEGCTNLNYVEFADGGVGFQTVPGNMFNTCTNLKIADLGNRFTVIGEGAFTGCSSLKEIRMPTTPVITTISKNAFDSCASLTSINLTSVKNIEGSAFKGCSSLTNVNIPAVTSIGNNAFQGCTKLKITLGESLTTIGSQAFSGCISLDAIEMPKSVITIGANAFENCTILKSVILSKNTKNITGDIFQGCPSDLVVYCTDSMDTSKNYIIYEIKNDSYAEIIKANIVIPNSSITLVDTIYGKPVRTISPSAFANNLNIKEITIPKSVTIIGAGAFEGCQNLTKVNFANESELTTIGDRAFKDCAKLINVDLKKATKLKTIGIEAFMNCQGLTEITIPKSVTAIGARAFKGCTSLKYVFFEKVSQLTSVGEGAFNSGVTIWYEGDCSFENCPGVILVGEDTVPEIVAYITTIPSRTRIWGAIIGRGVGIYEYAITTQSDPTSVTNWVSVASDEDKFVQFDTASNKAYNFNKNGKVYIHAKDKMGNATTYEIDVVGLDEIAPKIEGVTCENNSGVSTLTITASDEGGSYLSKYLVTTKSNINDITDSDKWSSFTGKNYEQTVTWNLTENGRYYIYVVDGAGNLASADGSVYGSIDGGGIDIELWDLDLYAPWIQESYVYTETGKIEAWLRDKGTGLVGYAIDTTNRITENTKWKEISNGTSDVMVKYVEEIIEIPGNYFIHVKDGQGNTVTKQIIYNNTPIVDKTAPRIVFGDKTNNAVRVILEDGSGVASGAKIKYAFSSAGEGVPEYYATANVVYSDGEAYFDAYGKGITSGNYYLYVKVETLKDSIGNSYDTTELATSPMSYRFSNESLQVEVSLNNKIIREGKTATYTLSFIEPVELVKGVEIAKADSNCTGNAQYIAKCNGSNYTWNITITAGEGNGTLGFRIPKEMFRSLETGNTFKRDIFIEETITLDNTSPNVMFESLDKSCVRENGEAVYTVTTSELSKVDIGSIYDIVAQQVSGGYLMCNDARVEKAPDDTTPGNYGTKWLITIVGGNGDGQVYLSLPEGLFRDIVDNQSEAIDIYDGNLTFDNTSPKVDSLSEAMSKFVNKNTTLEFNLITNENVQYKETTRTVRTNVGTSLNNDAKVTIEPQNSSQIDALTNQFKITVAGITGDGLVKVTIPKENFTDIAGNELEADVVITNFSADNLGPNIGTVEKTQNEENTEWTVAVQVTDGAIGLDKYVLSTESDVSKVPVNQWKKITEEEKTAKKIANIKIDVKAVYYLYVKDLLNNTSYKVIDATTLTDIISPEIKSISEPSAKNVNSQSEVSYELVINEEIDFSNSLDDITIIIGNEQLRNVMVLTEPTEMDGPVMLVEANEEDQTKVKVTFKGLTGDGAAKIIIPKTYFVDKALNSMKNDIELTGVTVDNTKATKQSNSIDKTVVNSSSVAVYTLTMTEPVEYIKAVDDLKVNVVNSITGVEVETSAAVAIQPNTLTEKIKISVKGLTGTGKATLKIPEGFFKDKSGNLTDEILIEGLLVDNAGPKGSFEKISKTLTKAADDPIVYTIKTDEVATLNTKVLPLIDSVNVGPACKNIKIEAANIERTKWTITLTECTGDGEISLVLPKGLFTDAIGNESEYTKISDGKLVFDNTKPKIKSISEPTTTFVNSNTTLEFTAEMSEEIIYQKTSRNIDVKVGDQTKPATVAIEPILPSDSDMLTTNKVKIKITVKELLGDGEAVITIPREYFKDIVGNELEEDIVLKGMTVDNIIPRIESKVGPSNAFVNASGKSEYTVTISEPVNFEKTEEKITVNSQPVADDSIKITLDSVNKKQVRIEVTGLTGNGVANIRIPKEYFKDSAGNTLYTDIELTGITVDNTIPIVNVQYTKTERGIKITLTANEELQLPDNTWTAINPLTIEKEVTSDFYNQMSIKDKVGNIANVEVNAVFITGIYLLEKEGEIVVSRTKQLSIETLPANAPFKDVVWASSDESIATVDANGVITAKKLGNVTITVTLANNSQIKDTYNAKIVPRAIKSIAVSTKPTKVEYVQGEKLEIAGGKLTLTYNDETTQVIGMDTPQVAISGFENTIVGRKTVTVTYDKKTATFDVNVIAKVVDSISVKTLPKQVDYVQNRQMINLTGGVLQLTYNDKQTEDIPLTTAEILVEGFDNTNLGKCQLTIRYQGKTTTFDVNIIERALSSISVKTLPDMTYYLLNKQALNLTGGVLKLTYNDEGTEDIPLTTEGIEATGFDNSKLGKQSVTITYKGKATTFEVKIIEKNVASIAIKTLPTIKEYIQNKEKLILEGGILKATYEDKTTVEIPLTNAEIAVTGFDNTKLGKQTLTVTYEKKITTFEVEVISAAEAITITVKEDSGYKITDEMDIINIKPNTTINDFLSKITTDGTIKVYEKSEEVKGTDGIIKTGMEIEITKSTRTKTYKLVVLGDVNGSGTVNVADMTTMMMHIAETLATKQNTAKLLTGSYLKAAYINSDAKVNIADLTSLMKIIAENK